VSASIDLLIIIIASPEIKSEDPPGTPKIKKMMEEGGRKSSRKRINVSSFTGRVELEGNPISSTR